MFIRDLITLTGGQTTYAHISGTSMAPIGSESQVASIAPSNFNVQGGYVNVTSNTMTADTVVTLRVNGADSGLLATITAGAIGAIAFAGGPIVISDGDIINYQITTTGSPDTRQILISSISIDL